MNFAAANENLERIGAELRDEARISRIRFRKYLAGQYDRDRFFRVVTPDVAGFEVYRLGSARCANGGSADYTGSLVRALRKRLLWAAQCTGDYPLPGAAVVTETLRIAILGELRTLRAQRGLASGLRHGQAAISTILGEPVA